MVTLERKLLAILNNYIIIKFSTDTYLWCHYCNCKQLLVCNISNSKFLFMPEGYKHKDKYILIIFQLFCHFKIKWHHIYVLVENNRLRFQKIWRCYRNTNKLESNRSWSIRFPFHETEGILHWFASSIVWALSQLGVVNSYHANYRHQTTLLTPSTLPFWGMVRWAIGMAWLLFTATVWMNVWIGPRPLRDHYLFIILARAHTGVSPSRGIFSSAVAFLQKKIVHIVPVR